MKTTNDPIYFAWVLLMLFAFTFSACQKEEDPVERNSLDPSCYDGVLNNDEEDIDCGGFCLACATCNDGIQNQGEEGIDCGGPCSDNCPFSPPCNYAANTALTDHLYTTVQCNSNTKTIVGEGDKGKITISFANYPSSSEIINLQGSNSVVIEDFLLQDSFVSTGGKLYIQFTGNKFIVTFCSASFTTTSNGNFLASGRVDCD